MNTETLGKLASATEDALVALEDARADGVLPQAKFEAACLLVLLKAKLTGVQLADLALSAELTRLRKRVVNPLGLSLPDDAQDTAQAALRDTLDSPQYAVNAAAAVAVLGRSETLAAAQEATSDGLIVHGVEGWTRDLNEGACELCRDLAGDVLPASARMYHHKGCGCTQRPVTTERKPA